MVDLRILWAYVIGETTNGSRIRRSIERVKIKCI